MTQPLVIVVADDWGFRRACRIALSRAGYRVAAPTTRNGASYFLSSAYPPHAVVLSARERWGEVLQDAIDRAVRPVAVVAFGAAPDERSGGPRPLVDAVQAALEQLADANLPRRGDPASLELGVSELDAPHRDLLARLNAAETALRDGIPDLGAARLEELCSSTQDHFTREEALMELHGHEAREVHAQEHLRLLEELRALARQTTAKGPASRAHLILALRDWLEGHIRTMDRTLADRLVSAARGS